MSNPQSAQPVAGVPGPLGVSVTCPWCLEGFTMLAAAPQPAEAAPKQECCGNPLRGCAECPPAKKLTFEEWMYSLGWAYVNAPLTEEDLKTIWKTAQESK